MVERDVSRGDVNADEAPGRRIRPMHARTQRIRTKRAMAAMESVEVLGRQARSSQVRVQRRARLLGLFLNHAGAREGGELSVSRTQGERRAIPAPGMGFAGGCETELRTPGAALEWARSASDEP